MKGRAILVCGRLCCGKTTYTEKLIKARGGVLLSCDEITLSLFDGDLGDRHDEMVRRVKEYLLKKAAEIMENGVDVILDWGFWSTSDRAWIRGYFSERGLQCELHYLDVPDSEWRRRIENRNCLVQQGEISAYYVDEGLVRKFSSMFESPEAWEIDVLVKTDVSSEKEGAV